MSKFELVSYWNKEARREIELAGSPKLQGHYYYDTEAIWGLTEEEIDEVLETAKKRMKSKRRKVRNEAKETYYRWRCREAASKCLTISWM